MHSVLFDRQFLEERGRQEGERRVRERHPPSDADLGGEDGPNFFPLPGSWPGRGRVILLDESGHHFALANRAGEDTALVVSRCAHVVAPPGGQLRFGPRVDSVFYPGSVGRLVADLNTLCAVSFGGRIPYRHSDVADFGERIEPRKILELISQNNTWDQLRSLWSSGDLHAGDIVLLDGSLNVVATPETRSADEIDGDLYESGIVLAGLSKSFAPKCADIVARGRQLYPGQAFIFTIPRDRVLSAHSGDDDNQMILTLGPSGRTLGLQFGIALGTDEDDLEYHGLFLSYRHNEPHRLAIERGEVVKVFDPLELTPAFVEGVLIPVGARLAEYSKGVVSPDYPLPAGAVHSHVLFTADDLQRFIEPMFTGMLEGGETLRTIEHDSRNHPHDPVDVILNRFYRR